jgi:hypothetical protein
MLILLFLDLKRIFMIFFTKTLLFSILMINFLYAEESKEKMPPMMDLNSMMGHRHECMQKHHDGKICDASTIKKCEEMMNRGKGKGQKSGTHKKIIYKKNCIKKLPPRQLDNCLGSNFCGNKKSHPKVALIDIRNKKLFQVNNLNGRFRSYR